MLLNKKQAADMLGVCTDTLLTLTNKGDILGFKVGGQWRFDKRDIDNYVDQQRQNAVHRTATKNKIAMTSRQQVEKSIIPTWIPGMRIQDGCA